MTIDIKINRKLKTLDNKTGRIIMDALNVIVDTHNYNRGSYFFKSWGSGRGDFVNKLSFVLTGDVYNIEQVRTSSARNVYFYTSISVNGDKKTIRALKQLL